MTIFNSDILSNHRPYIQFADCADYVGEDKLHRRNLAPFVFFEFSDSLLEVYCSITNSSSPFDPYEDAQIGSPHEIRHLASELLFWTIQILRTREYPLAREVTEYSFYEGVHRPGSNGEPTAEDLRVDLIETLLFLVGRFNRIASSNRCLVISSI